MDLFRRLFGRTSEETPDKNVTPIAPATKEDGKVEGSAESPVTEEEIDELDPTTRPLVDSAVQDMPLGAAGVTQPLPPESMIARKTDYILFGQVSDVGLVRTNNQDSAVSFFSRSASIYDQPDFGLFVVADGMGGHHDGEKASSITTKVLATNVTKEVFLPLVAGVKDPDRPPLTELLVSSIQKANTAVLKEVPDGGTTVTAVVVIGDLAHVAHVGDSRAYLITEEGVEQITRDHSLVQRLIELDQLTPEEAATHPQKNVLYRALGQTETLEVDMLTRRLPANSRLLVCSDGLWGLVEERDIYEISMNNHDPQQACEKLVALANTQGGIDNITAILLNIT